MSTSKFIQSLSEDPQLEKQIGCMTGIIQLFDRHQLLTGRRLYGHKRIGSAARSMIPTSCEDSGNEGNSVRTPRSSVEETRHILSLQPAIISEAAFEQNGTSKSSYLEGRNILRPASKDLVGICLEESKGQMKVFASADDSTRLQYNSLDSFRSLHEGKPLARKSIDNSDNTGGVGLCNGLLKVSTDTKDAARSSLDIRDIVRASFDRELPKLSMDRKGGMAGISKVPSGLSVEKDDSSFRFSERKEVRRNLSKPGLDKVSRTSNILKDSLRQYSTSSESMFITQTSEPPCKSVDLNKSLISLAKLRESPWDFVDSGDVPRSTFDSSNGPGCSMAQDAPRFSYDGREVLRPSLLDGKDLFKSSQKIKEAPRLSLDSKLAFKGTSKSFADMLPSSQPPLSSTCSEEKEYPVNGKCCPTNVVARLMGLDEMPVSSQQNKLVPKRQPFEGKLPKETVAPIAIEEKLQLQLPSNGRQNVCTQVTSAPKYLPHSTKYQAEPGLLPKKYQEIGESIHSEYSMMQTNRKHLQMVPTLSKALSSQSDAFHKQQEAGGIPWEDQGHLPVACGSSLSPCQLFEHTDTPEGTDAFYKEAGKRLKQMGFPNSEQELRALKQLYDSIQFKGLLHSMCPEHTDKVHQNPEICNKQDGTLERVCNRRATRELKFRKIPKQQGSIPVEYSRSVFPANLHVKSDNCGLETNASMMNGQSPAKKGRSQCSSLDIPLHRENERFEGYIMNSDRVPVTRNRNKESVSASNRAITMSANIGRVTRSPSRVLSKEMRNKSHNEPVSKALVVQHTLEKHQTCNMKSSLQKQSITQEIGKRARTAANILKDKEESRANLVMHYLKYQSTQLQMPFSGRDGTDTLSKLGNHRKNLDRLLKPETHERLKGKKAERVLSSAKWSKIEGDTHSENSSLLSSSLKGIEMPSKNGDLKSRPLISREETCNKPLQSETAMSTKMMDSSWNGTNDLDEYSQRQSFVGRTKQKQANENVNASIAVRLNSGEAEQDLDCIQRLSSSFQQIEQFQNEGTGFHSILPAEIPEQPSPVSVLDAAFYNDDDPPSLPKKGSLPFKGTGPEVGSCAAVKTFEKGDCPNNATSCGFDACSEIAEMTNDLQKFLTDDGDCQRSLSWQDVELKCLKKITAAVGLMEGGNSVLSGSGVLFHPQMDVLISQKSDFPGYDCQQNYDNCKLEQECTQELGMKKLNQKLHFDVAIEILREKMHPFVIQNHTGTSFLPILGRQWRGEELVELVWKELCHLQTKPYEDICDALLSFVESDLAHSENQWREHKEEMVEICLTMENLIFKDLVDETIQDLCCPNHQMHASASQIDQSTAKRQLVYVHT